MSEVRVTDEDFERALNGEGPLALVWERSPKKFARSLLDDLAKARAERDAALRELSDLKALHPQHSDAAKQRIADAGNLIDAGDIAGAQAVIDELARELGAHNTEVVRLQVLASFLDVRSDVPTYEQVCAERDAALAKLVRMRAWTVNGNHDLSDRYERGYADACLAALAILDGKE